MKNDIDVDITLPSHTRYLRMIGTIGEKVAQEVECAEEIRETLPGQLAIVLTEGVVNAIKHGKCAEQNNEIRIRISISNKNLVVTIHDNGVGFDLEAIPPPCFTSCGMLEKGRGIYILRSIMDSVQYIRSTGGNILEMRKKLS